jgi:ribosomal protein L12E/L44/L45/RPP1/RPP2
MITIETLDGSVNAPKDIVMMCKALEPLIFMEAEHKNEGNNNGMITLKDDIPTSRIIGEKDNYKQMTFTIKKKQIEQIINYSMEYQQNLVNIDLEKKDANYKVNVPFVFEQAFFKNIPVYDYYELSHVINFLDHREMLSAICKIMAELTRGKEIPEILEMMHQTPFSQLETDRLQQKMKENEERAEEKAREENKEEKEEKEKEKSDSDNNSDNNSDDE